LERHCHQLVLSAQRWGERLRQKCARKIRDTDNVPHLKSFWMCFSNNFFCCFSSSSLFLCSFFLAVQISFISPNTS
jgi:hypothetical protein